MKLISALPVTCGNGPEAAVTPGSLVVAASRAEETWALTTAVTCAPRCVAKAWSKGALESTSRPRASVAAAVETSSTRPITLVGRAAGSPARAALTAGRPATALNAVPL